MKYAMLSRLEKSQKIEKQMDQFVCFLNGQGVEYALLGSPTGANILSSDLDLCVADSEEFEQVFTAYCELYGCSIVNKRAHATGIRFDYLFPVEGGEMIFSGPDVLTRTAMGREVVNYSDLLKDKVLSVKGYYKPSAIDDFIFYFLKRIDKSSITVKEVDTLRGFYEAEKQGINARLGAFFSNETCGLIRDSLISGLFSFDFVQKLNNEAIRRKRLNLSKFIFELKRSPDRIWNKTGLVVAFLGVDGSGKSTIGLKIQNEISPLFNGIARYHLRPCFLGGAGDSSEVVADPHGQLERGVLLSVAKLFYFLLDYLGGFLFKVLPLKIKSHLVIFDRYYHDMLIDPKRYRYGAPNWMAKTISWFIPKPDLFIVLDAPAEIIQARKQEVTFEETKRQRTAYLKFANEQGNCIVLDASADIEETVQSGCAAILDFLSKRQKKRMKIQ